MITREDALRPITLDSYKGQERIKKSLKTYIAAAKMRGDNLDHILIQGPSGLGKTTLANIIAAEMGRKCISTSAPALRTQADLIAVLMTVQEGDILFIDEIHRLNIRLEEMLYFALEDFKLDTKAGNDPVRINLDRFTLIGATTKAGNLTAPMRNRFSISLELRPYEPEFLAEIVKSSAAALSTPIDDESAMMIAKRSRGVPRIANGFLKRVRDVAAVNNNGVISADITADTFEMLEIDERGLNRLDRHYMDTMIKRFKLKPVGIKTLCAALDEDEGTVEETIEPYLVQVGLLERTARGRVITQYGYNLYSSNKEF